MKEANSIVFRIMGVLLGLLVLTAGVSKLFVTGADKVAGMLSGIFLFAWAPVFWAWILILSEIVFGALILARWKLKYTTIPPMIILAIATLFVTINWSALGKTPWSSVILHLIAITGYWMLMNSKK